ncbi:MAG TPA: menaquinone biosynthesis protein [Verrucomicrobiae bacterium]|nr:menaquinone biosynthesis protein [Verrucomicrobiae bacterium]
MSGAAAWRIGSVPYLNARPLIYGMEDQVTLCTPARLADLMYRNQFDVGLMPVAEVLLHDQYDILDGIAIAARGPVASVFLAHREPIEKLKRIAVDPASRTSVLLLRVLLKIGYHIEPEFYPRPSGAKLSEHEAMMLIGDDAIWYVTRNGTPRVWDLGEAWMDLTGLPFVFAVWALQRKSVARTSLPQMLRKAKADGLAHIEQIVQDATEATPEFLRDYYSKHVWYDLGEPEKRGLARFQQYVKELGLVGKTHDLRYVS